MIAPRLLMLAAVVALAGALAFMLRQSGVAAGRAEVHAAWQAEKDQAAEVKRVADLAEREKERAERERIEKERQAHAADLDRARRAAAGARSELDRLRDAINAAPGAAGVCEAAATAGGADPARTARELLGECAAAHQELAREADRIAVKLARLQAATAR